MELTNNIDFKYDVDLTNIDMTKYLDRKKSKKTFYLK